MDDQDFPITKGQFPLLARRTSRAPEYFSHFQDVNVTLSLSCASIDRSGYSCEIVSLIVPA